jgi:hypothetical protein
MTQLPFALRLAGLTASATGAVLAGAGGAAAESHPEGLPASPLSHTVSDTASYALDHVTSTAGAVLGGATASPVLPATLHTTADALESSVSPALDLQLNPLANTTTDPLSNSAGTRIADFRPITTAAVTGPLADGASARSLPGELLGGLPVTLLPPAGTA